MEHDSYKLLVIGVLILVLYFTVAFLYGLLTGGDPNIGWGIVGLFFIIPLGLGMILMGTVQLIMQKFKQK